MTPVRPEHAVSAVLAALDQQPSAAAYARAARELVACGTSLERVRVSLLASFTAAPLLPYLAVEAARNGFAMDGHVGPFNSTIQELVTPTSGSIAHQPDIVVVAQLLEDACPPLARDFSALASADVESHIAGTIADLGAALAAFRHHSDASVVLHNFTPGWPGVPDLCDGALQGSQLHAVRALNTRLGELAHDLPGVYVLDYERLVSEIGSREWWDPKMWYLGRAPLSIRALPALARRQAAYICAIRRPARKCLVLDLDDTLWGGVLGEVGVNGIKVGADYPGNIFRDFQYAVRDLKHRGVLLAINSKNNVDDAREAFLHSGMVLRMDDFSAVRINWNSKPSNMIEIAEELNIGVDSLVFVDDNPAERALMRHALPHVLTLELPQSPVKYTQTLLESGAFERLTVTSEDRRRTEIYQAQGQRRVLERSALTLDEFLASLQMHVTIESVNEASHARVADLLQKTNQFNLTTRRHSATQLAAMMRNPEYGLFTARVTDRFGDNGIVGVAIVYQQDDTAHLDILLLSCRVIGRTIETALLSFLVRWARERGLSEMIGEFIPTAKNAPAADFFARHHFEHITDAGSATSKWRLVVHHSQIAPPAYMVVSA